MLRGGMLGGYADPLTHLGCLLAAVSSCFCLLHCTASDSRRCLDAMHLQAAHDVDHRGLTNDFLAATEDSLAITYKCAARGSGWLLWGSDQACMTPFSSARMCVQ
jgi:hypothetical protein